MFQPPPSTEACTIIKECLVKWMLGLDLDGRERAVVDAAIAVNGAEMLLQIQESAS